MKPDASMLDRLFTRIPSTLIWLAPLTLLASLTALTVLVWRDQIAHQQLALMRHTEDIAVQSAQRLEDLVEHDLLVASLTARRWVDGEDRSHQRFEGFARVLTRELRVFDAVALLEPDRQVAWIEPSDDLSAIAAFTGPMGRNLMSQLSGERRIAVSGSDPASNRPAGFYALLPLDDPKRGRVGYLGVHFHADNLARQCFHRQLLEEFEIVVADGDTTLFHSTRPPQSPSMQARLIEALDPAPRVSVGLDVRNRHWRLTMQPLEPAKMSTWTGNLAVPRLGMLGASLISLTAYLLLQRMRSYQRARDEALEQVAERRRVEEALRQSEARYRDVFASATDGLVVVDGEGDVLEANEAAGAIVNVPAREMLGRSLREFYGPESVEYAREILATCSAPTGALEAVVTRGDGQALSVEIRATLLRQDERARALVIVTDVTERKRALERHAMLSRKVLVAQEEERARVARELHDELGQILTAIRLEMGWFKKHIDTNERVDMAMFHEAVKLVERAADESRRIVRGLRPPLLDDLGLEPAVRLLIDEFKDHTQVRTAMALEIDERVRVPREVALCTYRILQESLTNVSRHAKASRADVSLRVDSGRLVLEVADDGVGFDRNRRHGCGLEGMTERANLVNGNLVIHSIPGNGTRVAFTAVLPRLGQELSA